MELSIRQEIVNILDNLILFSWYFKKIIDHQRHYTMEYRGSDTSMPPM
jgi:hypothetical protein